MQMARSIDSDYIDLSLMGGFDMGIDFDGFEENVKKIMELPIKYLDSARGKAVELLEDVHAMLWDPFPDGEVPNKLHETFQDLSSSNLSGLSPTSVEMKLVGADAQVSNPASLITVENCSSGYSDMDAHETESVLTKNPENTSSKGGNVEANDMCLLPANTLKTEVHDSTTSEEIILWNPENSAKPSRSSENSSANCKTRIVLHSAEDSVDAAAHEAITHDLGSDVSRCERDSTMCPDDTANFDSVNLRNGQENMKNDKFEAPNVHLRQNTSFKKMFMRSLSSKLGLSKKQINVQQAVPARSQDEENLGYQLVSSSDDLDDDWEVL